MFTQTIGDATVTVEYAGKEFESFREDDYRRRYSYSIVTSEWRYDGNDLYSGVGAAIDTEHAARTLFSFLSACAESRAYGGGENADLFPEHVGQWAEENSDEIGLLSIDPAELD